MYTDSNEIYIDSDNEEENVVSSSTTTTTIATTEQEGSVQQSQQQQLQEHEHEQQQQQQQQQQQLDGIVLDATTTEVRTDNNLLSSSSSSQNPLIQYTNTAITTANNNNNNNNNNSSDDWIDPLLGPTVSLTSSTVEVVATTTTTTKEQEKDDDNGDDRFVLSQQQQQQQSSSSSTNITATPTTTTTTTQLPLPVIRRTKSILRSSSLRHNVPRTPSSSSTSSGRGITTTNNSNSSNLLRTYSSTTTSNNNHNDNNHSSTTVPTSSADTPPPTNHNNNKKRLSFSLSSLTRPNSFRYNNNNNNTNTSSSISSLHDSSGAGVGGVVVGVGSNTTSSSSSSNNRNTRNRSSSLSLDQSEDSVMSLNSGGSNHSSRNNATTTTTNSIDSGIGGGGSVHSTNNNIDAAVNNYWNSSSSFNSSRKMKSSIFGSGSSNSSTNRLSRSNRHVQQQQSSSSSNNSTNVVSASISSGIVGSISNNTAVTVQQRRYKVGDIVLMKPILLPSHENNDDGDEDDDDDDNVLLQQATTTTTTAPTNINMICHPYTCYVNKYGLVPNDPRCQSDVEFYGPYQYIMVIVQQIHFEEVHPYYTVQRCDCMNLIHNDQQNHHYSTNTIQNNYQRADYYQIELIHTQRHEMAAKQASDQSHHSIQQAIYHNILWIDSTTNVLQYNTTSNNNNNNNDNTNRTRISGPPMDDFVHQQHQHSHNYYGNDYKNNSIRSGPYRHHPSIRLPWYQYIILGLQYPYYCIVDGMYYIWSHILIPTKDMCLYNIRYHANLCLNGREPYLCRIRLTMLNFVVLCSAWFMFIDQVRLAFFHYTTDNIVAMISFAVWIVLILELFCEVYIRPDGYQNLLISEKAYAPTTVRYINTIHFVIELIALCAFISEFFCLFTNYSCSERLPFSFYNAVLMGVIGPTKENVFLGHLYIALVRIRIFCMVRHWKNMWITRTFINTTTRRSAANNSNNMLSNFVPANISSSLSLPRYSSSKDLQPIQTTISAKRGSTTSDKSSLNRVASTTDNKLTNASNIGTALMVINSYRTLAIVCLIGSVYPMIFSSVTDIINPMTFNMMDQLQSTNLAAADTSNTTCDFFRRSISSWLIAVNVRGGRYEPVVLTLDVQPYRCGYNDINFTNVDTCLKLSVIPPLALPVCLEWYTYGSSSLTTREIADLADVRIGSIMEVEHTTAQNFTRVLDDGSNLIETNTVFSVMSRIDHSLTIQIAARSSVILQIVLLIAMLGGLSILRRDVEILVLGPLRRMLKIVHRYASNPLIQTKISHRRHIRTSSAGTGHHHRRQNDDDTASSGSDDDDDDNSASEELGSFETEQLITAVTKITDLLRKCWGVAGADIISTNLSTQEGALTEVFNPTVPGKSVYALFGFAAIGGFDNALRNLGGEVMPLINDVAAVLHGEVFRWGFGDSGQCNKNLGSAFLMVFRIGLVKEVIEKLEQATDVVFSTSAGKKSQVSSAIKRRQFQRNSVLRSSSASNFSSPYNSNAGGTGRSLLTTRKRTNVTETSDAMSLSLQSLPGISTFTDRAVIGMLKSYAGIYRDKNILQWNNDFRLGAGVGAFKIGMIFGMDAGWAVEGAVGSEYKIDATYLSPHVNMASRMMSACKQYDVTIMLSQSVQELMSDVAQSKLRHLDTVTVKGSSLKQKIFTYDARAQGVDFFLHYKTDEQADTDAERYAPSMWNVDPDLIAMRQHITDDFLKAFKDGHKAFLSGDWTNAIQKLELANSIMFQSAIDEGYLEDEFEALNIHPGQHDKLPDHVKRDYGDGPSMYLVSFMKSHDGCVAPKDWDGWHPLNRK